MKILIIGYGSIAKKHHTALQLLESNLKIYALRNQISQNQIDGVVSIFSWEEIPTDLDFIIISNPTSEHAKTLIKAAKFGVPIFLEKPPVFDLSEIEETAKAVRNNSILTYCAFPLRFHPIIYWLRTNIDPSEVLEFSAYCGSFLPDWRPSEDYRKNYSAIEKLGGGVHLDLIHELDYIKWLFGAPEYIKGFTKKISDLEIDSKDSALYYLEYESKVGTIKLNYFRKEAKRTIELVTKKNSLIADLLQNTVTNSDGKIVFDGNYENKNLYLLQMEYFLEHLKAKTIMMNSFEESSETLKLCLNIEKR
jgi:predicted dehydrogenase